jgi:peptidoglycan/xylan/chitin deacetylase (PgdA/CDA1 family)
MEDIAPSMEARPTLLSSSADEDRRPLPTQPTVVSLTFDDGTRDQYAVRSILSEHSMRATFYVNSGAIGMPGYMRWEQLFELAADGNEIGGHTIDHVKLTTVSASEARRQIGDDRQALIGHGFTVTDFAYPHGDYNTSVESIVQACGYSSARRAWGLSPIGQTRPNCDRWYPDVAERIPPVDPYAMRTIVGLRPWNTLVEVESVVTRAENNGGGWVTFVFHRIGNGRKGDDGYSVSVAVFSAFLEWLECRVERGTRVLTVRDVVSKRVFGPSSALVEQSFQPHQERAAAG